MKYFKKFNNKYQYYKFRNSNKFIEPNISKIDTNVKIKNNYIKQYFTIELLESGSIQIHNYRVDKNNIYYSLDNGVTWVELFDNIASEVIDAHHKILLKGNITDYMRGGQDHRTIAFTHTTKYNVYGNIMSLFYLDDFANKTDFKNIPHACHAMFINTNIVDTGNLVLPLLTLYDNCYTQMFKNCSLLKYGPKILATNYTDTNTYKVSYMFHNCISLKYVNFENLYIDNTNENDFKNAFEGTYNLILIIKQNTEESVIDLINNKYASLLLIRKYKLPSEYNQVSYIASTSTGGQYIDLNLQMWAQFPLSYAIYGGLRYLGMGKNTDAQPTFISCSDESNNKYPGFVIRRGDDNTWHQNRNPKSLKTFTEDKIFNIFVNVGDGSQMTYTPERTTHNKSLYLFCDHDSEGNPFRFSELEIFSLKVKSNSDNWVRELVPCINPNGIPGLYDIVNNVFYKSLGDEELIAGPLIEELINFDIHDINIYR